MLRAAEGSGAEERAMLIEIRISTAAINQVCHKPKVSPSGITPLIWAIEGGREVGEAISSAADEERPSAHPLPTPRYAAAPTAR